MTYKGGLTVGDAAPILHSASSKVRDSEEIHLGKRVGNAKVLIIERKSLHGHLQRKAALLGLSRGSVATHKHTRASLALQSD